VPLLPKCRKILKVKLLTKQNCQFWQDNEIKLCSSKIMITLNRKFSHFIIGGEGQMASLSSEEQLVVWFSTEILSQTLNCLKKQLFKLL